MSEKLIKPIILLGVPRSGTTLLRVLLDSHTEILGAPETAWITGGYGDSSLRELNDYLVDNAIGAVKNMSGVDEELIITSSRKFISSILSGYLEKSGKKILVLKTPDDACYTDFLKKLFPDAKYVHIIRDGRDVACSTYRQKGKFFGDVLGSYGELTILNALKRWVDWEQSIRNFVAYPDVDAINVRYEDLVKTPETTLKKVCEFIGVKYYRSMLEYSKKNHEMPEWEAGSNDVKAKPRISRDSVGLWEKEMPISDRVEVNNLSGSLLQELGYISQSNKKDDIKSGLIAEIKKLNKIINAHEEEYLTLKNENELVKNQQDAKIEVIRKYNIDSELRLKQLNIELGKNIEKVNVLRERLDERNGELAILRSNRNKREEDIKIINNKLEKSSVENVGLKLKLENKNIELERLNIEINERKAKVAELNSQLEKRDAENHHLDSEIDKKNAEIDKQNAEIVDVTSKSEMLKVEVAELSSKLNERNTENSDLNSELSKRNADIGELNKLLQKQGDQINELRASSDKYDKETLELKNKLNFSEEKRSQEILTLTNKLEQLQRQLTSHTREIAQKNKVIDNLQVQINRNLEEKKNLQLNKDTGLQQLRSTPTFKAGRVIMAPAHYSKRLFKWIGDDKNTRSSQVKSNRPVELDLGDQIKHFYGNHRSGWSYAVSQLADINTSSGVYLDTFIERTFSWGPEGPTVYKRPWVGFIHVPPNVPKWFQYAQSNEAIFSTEQWKESYPYCKGLFTLSEYHKKALEKILDVPVCALLHPTPMDVAKWTSEAFLKNKEKRIVQVGWWLRKLHAIYELPESDYIKTFLRVNRDDYLNDLIKKEKEIHVKEGLFRESMYSTTEVIEYLDDDEYDKLLTENIVFLDLYDSSTNNAIIECIARSTPLLVNPIEPVIEYLGKDYPLYYSDYDEAIEKAKNIDLVIQAHEYLKKSPIKRKLTGDYFRNSIVNSSLLQNINI